MHAITSLGSTACRRSRLPFAAALFALAGVLAAAPKPTDTAKAATTLTPEGGRIVVDVQGVPPAVPLFFSAVAEQTIHVSSAELTSELRLKLHVVQGKPEMLSLGLTGEGEVTEVSGAGLTSWAVRQIPGFAKRFLDLRPALADGVPGPRDLDLVVRTRLRKPTVPGNVSVLLAAPGDAVEERAARRHRFRDRPRQLNTGAKIGAAGFSCRTAPKKPFSSIMSP